MAFIYDVAEVKDIGTHYVVNYVTTNNLVYIYPGKSYVKLSSSAADAIRGELQKGNVVSFAKGISREILPADIISSELRELEKEKALAQFRVGQVVDGYLAGLWLIEIFMHNRNFVMLNNTLADKGYFITEKNREKVYLDIINTEDEDLISDLEKYLEALDQINTLSSIYTKYSEFNKNIKSADTLAEIRELADKAVNSLVDPK